MVHECSPGYADADFTYHRQYSLLLSKEGRSQCSADPVYWKKQTGKALKYQNGAVHFIVKKIYEIYTGRHK
jgi:hypothetical protein